MSECETCNGAGLVEDRLGPGPDVYYETCPDCDNSPNVDRSTPIPAFTMEEIQDLMRENRSNREGFTIELADRVDAEHCLKIVRESDDNSPLAIRIEEWLRRSLDA